MSLELLEGRVVPTIAYNVAAGTNGNQNDFGGTLGMDFNVNMPIVIDQLGVFDSGSDGLATTIIARLWDRTTQNEVGVPLVFAPGATGTLIGGSRFLPLPTPITLPAGFQGTITAEGYGATEADGNFAVPPWTTNTGGGLISFVGTSRFGNAGFYPAKVDAGSVNSYAAGTFNFTAAPVGDPALPAAPASVLANVPEANKYSLVYGLSIPNTADFNVTGVPYSTNYAPSINQPFDRVAYYLELDSGAGTQFVWASFDSFTTNANFIGIPTSFVGQLFQRSVTNMNVVSNAGGIVTGTGLTGNIEFWPSNYAQALNATTNGLNQTPSPGNANAATFDFGDGGASNGAGYGSFQIHNPGSSQTLFAYNRWGLNSGEGGIGNRPTGDPDWTFANNIMGYTVKNLYVFVSDSIPPASPVITSPTGGTVVTTPTPTVTGTAEPNSSITVFDTDGITVLATTVADGSGNWAVATTRITPGPHTLTASAADAAGNESFPSAGVNILVPDGGVAPTPAHLTSVTSTTPTGKYRAGATISVTVNFDQAVTLSSGTLTVNLNTGGSVIISPFSGKSASGTYIVAPDQNAQSLDSISLVVSGGTLKDGNGNTVGLSIPSGKSLSNSANLLIDTTPPKVTISAPSATTTTTGPITFTINYVDTNFSSNTLTAADITLNKTGTANGTVSVSGGAGLFKTVTISNITGTGTLGISLAAGTASDTAGNLAPAAGPTATFNVTNTPPTATAAFAVGGANGTVRLLSSTGSVVSTLTPITGYTGLVSVALGDFNNDTVADLVVASASPAGVAGLAATDAGKVFVYDWVAAAKGTLTLVKTYTPFATSSTSEDAYTNGLNIATGDVDGDGKVDLIAGSRGGNGTTSGQVEVGRLVVIDGESPAGSNIVIGGIQTPFGPGYQKGVIVAAGNVDGLGGDEIGVTRGGPVASTNPAVQSIKVKVLQLQGTDLEELPLNADDTTAFAPFAGLTGAASGISRDGRVTFVDNNGDGKDELVFTAIDPLTSTTNTQIRVGVFAIDPLASKAAATIVSTGPDAGTYVTGKAVVDHAITAAAATGAQQNIALLTESAASGMVFLAPRTGAVQTGGFSLNIATGGITLDGI